METDSTPMTRMRVAELRGCTEGAVRAAIKRGELALVQVGTTVGGAPVMMVDPSSARRWRPDPAMNRRGGK